jgi:hypothetical protein
LHENIIKIKGFDTMNKMKIKKKQIMTLEEHRELGKILQDARNSLVIDSVELDKKYGKTKGLGLNLERADEIVEPAVAVASKLGMISGSLDMAAIAWQFLAPNTDGSYDFYIIRGSKYTNASQKTIPVYLDFMGFVPDKRWGFPVNIKMPISKNLDITKQISDTKNATTVWMTELQDPNKLIPRFGQSIVDKLKERTIEIKYIIEVADDFRAYIPDPDFSTNWYGSIDNTTLIKSKLQHSGIIN